MDSLKLWIIRICCTLFFLTAVEMLLPSNSLKKYAKFVFGLLLIVVIIDPIVKVFSNGINTAVYTSAAMKYMDNGEESKDISKVRQQEIESTLSNFEKNLDASCEKELKTKFPKDNFTVTVEASYDSTEEQFTIKKVNVGVQDGSISKVKKIEIGKETSDKAPGNEVDEGLSSNIKTYLTETLKIDESIINIYKL